MKISTIISFFLILAACNVSGQKLNCSKFKNGEFRILKDSISSGSTIERNGNFQTERVFGKTEVIELIVDWIDDCTYTLKPKNMGLEMFKGLPENALLTVEIIEIKENSYIQKSTSNFAEYEVISEVYKIK